MAARHVITADKYDVMVEAGAFNDERVELMLGEIVDMSPIGSAHQACLDRLTTQVAPAAASGEVILRAQGSVRLDSLSVPQPDIALLRPRADFYAERHPVADEVLLVIEVADSSLRYDRTVKLPAYTAAGIPEAWLVDLNAGVVEVSTSPARRDYRQVVEALPGDVVTPVEVKGLDIPVGGVLGVA